MSEESTTNDRYAPSRSDDRRRSKKSTAWIWALVLGIGCFLPVVASVGITLIGRATIEKMEQGEGLWGKVVQQRMARRTERFRGNAEQFIELGQAGELDAAYELCGAQFRSECSRDELPGIFERLDEDAGAYQSLYTVLPFDNFSGDEAYPRHVELISKFDVGDILLKFAFQEEGGQLLIQQFEFDATLRPVPRLCPSCQRAHPNHKATVCEACGERLGEHDSAAESEPELGADELDVEDAAQDD